MYTTVESFNTTTCFGMTANFRSLNPHKANTVLVPTFSTRKYVYYNAWTKQFQNWLLFVCLFVQKLLAWIDSRTYSLTIRRVEMTYGLFRQSMQIRPKHFYGYVYYFYCYVYVFLLLCPPPVRPLAKSTHSSAHHSFDRRSLFPSWSG